MIMRDARSSADHVPQISNLGACNHETYSPNLIQAAYGWVGRHTDMYNLATGTNQTTLDTSS
jgi:hypothetical protein